MEIIAGGANNQLAENRHGDELENRGILYAPDYVINGGGVINVYGEIHRWPAERAQKKAGEIYDTLLRIFEIARAGEDPDLPRGRPPGGAADRGGGRAGPDVDEEVAGRPPRPSAPLSDFIYIRDRMPEVIPIGADTPGFT